MPQQMDVRLRKEARQRRAAQKLTSVTIDTKPTDQHVQRFEAANEDSKAMQQSLSRNVHEPKKLTARNASTGVKTVVPVTQDQRDELQIQDMPIKHQPTASYEQDQRKRIRFQNQINLAQWKGSQSFVDLPLQRCVDVSSQINHTLQRNDDLSVSSNIYSRRTS